MTNFSRLSRRHFVRLLGAGIAVIGLPGGFAHAVITDAGAPVLPERLDLGVPFGRIGPDLIEAGAIEPEAFTAVHERAGQPLTELQRRILLEGSEQTIVLDSANSYFLLNLLWAFGLTNDNSILTRGPMLQAGLGKVGQYASTGGWRLGRKPPLELYASAPLVTLSAAQQGRLREVADGVYRPCCDNSTSFPDCNHGMAMLALLELLAAHDLDRSELFTAAKIANLFWYPKETLRLATYYKVAQGIEYSQADARETMGRERFSISGYRRLEDWLKRNGVNPPEAPNRSAC